MSTEDDVIKCKTCGKEIITSDFLAHLVDHVSGKFKEEYNVNITPDDVAQIHDLIMSRYDDLVDVDVDTILDDFENTRIVVDLEYPPLSISLYRSVEKGYFLAQDGRYPSSFGVDRTSAIFSMIGLINKSIQKNLEDGYYNIQVSGVPSSTCSRYSYHMKVPNTWLGVLVLIRKLDGEDKGLISVPVRCGNSVHVTVPQEWSTERVSVTLDYISDENDLVRGGKNASILE